MKIICLGTGSARAQLNRFHSSVLISSNAHQLLIDAGDGISRALKANNINPKAISSILISHFHSDHIAGLPLLITQMKMNKRKIPLKIFVAEALKNSLISLLNLHHHFLELMPFPVEIIGFNDAVAVSVNEYFSFKPIKNSHLKPKEELKNISAEYFSSFSFILMIGERNIYYSADVGKGEDFFSFNEKINAAFLETTHINLESIKKFSRLNKDAKIFLTHIDDEKKVLNFVEALEADLKKRITILEERIIIRI